MRTFDATVHNLIASNPAVFRNLGGDGPMLFDGAIEYPDVYWFLHNEAGDAAMLFEQSAPGVYEQHTMFAPSCRGRRAISEAKALVAEMFVDHGAEIIWGAPPMENRPARLFNRWLGADPVGTRTLPSGVECEVFVGRRAEWLAKHWNSPRA